ncbi:HDIG domain-containing protein [bacterium]|nr:HDIG domain-containing protein [bacterium]
MNDNPENNTAKSIISMIFSRQGMILIIRWIMFIMVVAGITLLFPGGGTSEFSEIKLNSINQKEIIAPFEFEILKSQEQLEEERKQASASIPPVFRRKDDIAQFNHKRLDSVFQIIGNLLDDKSNLTDAKTDSAFKRISDNYRITLNRNILDISNTEVTLEWWSSLGDRLGELIDKIYTSGIPDREPETLNAPGNIFNVLSGGIEKHTSIFTIFPINLAKREIFEGLKNKYNKGDRRINLGYETALNLLEPNLIYQEDLTTKRRQQAASRVPIAKGIVLKNERIIDSNERVTQQHIDKIRSLIAKKAELAQQEEGFKRLFPIAGKLIFTAAIVLLFGLLVFNLDTDNRENRILLLLALLALSHLAYLRLILIPANLSDLLFPIGLAAMLAAIFCGQRIGFWFMMALAVFAGALRGGEYQFTMVNLVVGAVAVLSVKRLQSRTKLLRSSFFLAAAYILLLTAYHFMQYSFSPELFLQDIGYAFLNSLMTPILALGFAIILGNIFNITTDLTLLELSDLNRPLLRELAAVAPGTYHHSLMVGTLSESAAEAVGANPLLARTGSYYHDIGKMDRRDYFVENQFGFNPHDTIIPLESAQILASHVQSGLEKAEKNRLPKVIKDIIVEHHGSSMMKYFYHKVLARKGIEVNPDEYRYHGPLPVSEESAIIMLADGVEAAVRSAGQSTPEQIRKKVQEIIEGKYAEGQLDNCHLSLKDLQTVKDSFVSSLMALSHKRIAYPTREQMNKVASDEGSKS